MFNALTRTHFFTFYLCISTSPLLSTYLINLYSNFYFFKNLQHLSISIPTSGRKIHTCHNPINKRTYMVNKYAYIELNMKISLQNWRNKAQLIIIDSITEYIIITNRFVSQTHCLICCGKYEPTNFCLFADISCTWTVSIQSFPRHLCTTIYVNKLDNWCR